MTDENQQRTEEWRHQRLGKVTASRVHDVVAQTKSGGWTAARKNYMSELICERLTGVPTEHYVNAAMAYGTQMEPEARDAYSFLRDVEVAECGFIDHDEIAMAGGSPDGLVGHNGLVEIKCPLTATHLETLRTEKIPVEYYDQMQFNLACTDRQWCDYVSYDRRLPVPMRMLVVRVERATSVIHQHEKLVREFLTELDQTVEYLRKRYLQEAAA